MADPWKKYLDEKMSFILKHMDSYDFLCGDDLFAEKGLMSSVMRNMEINSLQRCSFIGKSAERAVEKRNIGNQFFTKKFHDESTHVKAFVYYTESIAAAPNDSEELSVGYSNRATLLCHLAKYKECLQDCDKALDAVKSDQLKVKLLFRKTEAFIGLHYYSKAKEVWVEANSLLKKTNMTSKLMEIFTNKSQNFARIIDGQPVEETDNINKDQELADELPAFEPNEEAPSASKAIAINYNEEWGRHIVATRSIEPGELLVREKSYFSFLDPSDMYLYCSHCTKPSWNLIPCNGCIFDVYCSDECRLEAKEKYHKFECPVFPYLCEKDSDIRIIFCHLRFLLVAVHNAGGIEKLKREQVAAQTSTDPRKKGFIDDIFHSNELRSCLSVGTKCDKLDYFESLGGAAVCYAVYHLATKTDFFGKKFDITPVKMVAETHMIFFAGLMYRLVFCYNSLTLTNYHPNGKVSPMGISLHPFCSLFNNSCSSNTDLIFTEDNEIIVYANQPIKKDSQVFISYHQCDILLTPKDLRKDYYKVALKFTCECTPCKENWSHICLPLLKDLLETAPDTLTSIELMINNLNNEISQKFVYKENLMNKVINIMKVIAEKATVNCEEYRKLGKIMNRIFIKSFGKKPLIFPESC